MKQYNYLGYIITRSDGWYSTTIGGKYCQSNKMETVMAFIENEM